MNLDAKIEAILFWKGESVSVKKLSQILDASEEDILAGISLLEEKLKDRGLQIIRKEDEILLGTHKDASQIIEKLFKDELVKDLGKAGLETLSIILYRSPVARKDIDYIRGVNSQFIVRNLLIRGLIERVQSDSDQRQFLYKPTFELLAHLGISKIEDLPEYAEVRREMENHENTPQEHN